MLIKDIVIHEDKHFLAVNKPAGVTTHGGEKVTGEILADFLAGEYPELKTVGDEPRFRPGIVHRLDRDTSGIMLVARTNQGYEGLKKLFQTQQIQKRYLALTCGVIKKDFWEIKSLLGRSKKNYAKHVSLPLEDDELAANILKTVKIAHTEFETIENLQNRFTLLYAYPKTGRMHQIRVQLSSFGFPVACDTVYGKKHGCCPLSLGRLFLHSESIRFTLFDSKFIFTAPLPAALDNFLKKMRVAEKKHM